MMNLENYLSWRVATPSFSEGFAKGNPFPRQLKQMAPLDLFCAGGGAGGTEATCEEATAVNIQDPNQKFDCFACGGKGYFLMWTRLHGRPGRLITRQSYLKSPLIRPQDGYEQVDCGECGGTGKLEIGEVKY